MAQVFERIGYQRLHVVDLDGAKSKHIVNGSVLSRITSETKLTVDFGGGIKTDEDIEEAFRCGASMVTIGSIAVTEPVRFMGWLGKYGSERIILGADVRNGRISINGWKEDSSEDLLPFLKKYIDAGVSKVLCTEISKDGTFAGPAIDLYQKVMETYPELHLIASGGVSSMDDIKALDAAGIQTDDVYQGTNLTPVIRITEGLMKDGKINIGDNDLLKIHFLNSALKTETETERVRLIKIEQRAHIDGMAAFLDAMTMRDKYWKEIGSQLINERRQ
jgi:phosphoribosylformimino-5-aminoimidazole carboxamide ribotide isomerase